MHTHTSIYIYITCAFLHIHISKYAIHTFSMSYFSLIIKFTQKYSNRPSIFIITSKCRENIDFNETGLGLSMVIQLQKAMAPHSSTLLGKSHGWRSLVGCSPWGR